MRILFYTSTPRSFQTTLIGYLYEICQVHPVVLLAEELPQDVLKFLERKDVFPKLEKIVPVEQYTGKARNLLTKNHYLHALAKELVKEYQPSMVITANDVYPFEMYLMRLAKKVNTVNVCMQSSFEMPDKKEEVSFSVLQNAYSQYPSFLSLQLRLFLVRLKKVVGHILYYWMLPLTVGEKPFLGKASLIIWNTSLFPQTSDYRTVFSKRDYDTYTQYGFPPENAFILPHPLKGKAREIFQQMYAQPFPHLQTSKRTLTIMWPDETISFRRRDYSLIPQEELAQTKMEIVRMIRGVLKDWKIFIKPHPAMKHDNNIFQELLSRMKSISLTIEVVKPEEVAETYIGKSDVIVGFPPASTTLYIASLWHPGKPILSVNLVDELLGDFYEDVSGVEYIDTEEKLREVLGLIRTGRYQKKPKQEKTYLGKQFSNTVEAVETLYAKR